MKNDMTDVKISVIVPCHNVVGMVGECLESIVNQTIGLSHLEIILVIIFKNRSILFLNIMNRSILII